MAIGLYIHIPFCVKKCPYCDFTSGPVQQALRRSHLAALEAEIRHSPWKGASVRTIFFGGGTPSELTLAELENLVQSIRESFDLRETEEWTLECNPGTARPPKLRKMLELGFNRLSLGVQSFNDQHLETLGRIHNSAEARLSYRWARECGFENINLDLIFGLPNQTLSDWEKDLEQAIQTGPEHLSLYHLTIEPETPFAELDRKGLLHAAPEESAAEMFELAMDLTEKAGYRQYEISNYAKPGHECRHNQIYWQNGDFLGFGLSAASHMRGRRWVNTGDFADYSRSAPKGRASRKTDEQLPSREALGEEMMLRVRTAEGIDLNLLTHRYGLNAGSLFAEDLNFFRREGLITSSGDRITLTRKGKLLANQVAAAFL